MCHICKWSCQQKKYLITGHKKFDRKVYRSMFRTEYESISLNLFRDHWFLHIVIENYHFSISQDQIHQIQLGFEVIVMMKCYVVLPIFFDLKRRQVKIRMHRWWFDLRQINIGIDQSSMDKCAEKKEGINYYAKYVESYLHVYMISFVIRIFTYIHRQNWYRNHFRILNWLTYHT